MDASYVSEYLSLVTWKLLEILPDWVKAVVNIFFVSISTYSKQRFDSYIIFKINSQRCGKHLTVRR